MPTVFLLQPLRPEFDRVRDVVIAAAAKAGMDVIRPDAFFGGAEVAYERIAQTIREDVDCVIADLSGSNANVMYELGLTQASARPVVLITSDPIVPFDLRSRHVIHYDPDDAVVLERFEGLLIRALEAAVANPEAFIERRPPRPPSNRIFVSYSHADARYVERLLVHLKPLELEGTLDAWTDRRIDAGSRWREEIKAALHEAVAAILLISADFLASEFIIKNELPPLLKRAETEGTVVIPLILKPCRYVRDATLRDLQAINDPIRPLAALPEVEQEALLDKVAETVERALRR
jgi:hypothetical protein